MSDIAPVKSSTTIFPLKAWFLVLLMLVATFALIAVLSNRCAPDGGDYHCTPPFDGLENALLLGLLVAGPAFVILLAAAIIRTAGWIRAARQSN